MVAFAEAADVEARLRRDLTDVEAEFIDAMILEAQVLVEACLGCAPNKYPSLNDVPTGIRIVTSGMVSRAIKQDEQGNTAIGVQQASQTAGPFVQQQSYTQGANTGGPWLSGNDKVALRPYMCRGRAFTLETAPLAVIDGS